jgi:hypothetical protein
MRQKAILALALAIFSSASIASTRDLQLVARCGGPFQLCGYAESGTEVLQIPQKFEVAQPFSEGLAAVRVNGRYGFIDKSGMVVVAPRFQAAGSFTGEYAEVRLNGASGIINREGRLVVPATYKRIIPFHGGTFVAEPLREQQRPFSSSDGRLETLSDRSLSLDDNDGGLFDIRRGWITSKDLKFSFFDKPERGLIWAGKQDSHNANSWGLLKADGSWQVTMRYNHVQSLNETHAVVESLPDYSLPPSERWNAFRRGAVDRNGKLVVPLKFAQLSYWSTGYGRALDGKQFNSNGSENKVKEGIVKADGTLLADRYFDKVDRPGHQFLPRGRVGETWFSIEPSGRLIPDQLDGTPLLECVGGLTIIQRAKEVEFLRSSDHSLVGRFERSFYQRSDCPGPFTAKRGGKLFVVFNDGTVLGGTRGFDNIYAFSGSHTAVEVDGKWGIIDRSGAFTVRPLFTNLRNDRKGTFVVDDAQAKYWIDALGKRVEQPPVERQTPKQTLTCNGGLKYFQKAGLWGFQDGAGQTIIEPRFRALSCFKQGISWAVLPGGRAWCPIGPDGQKQEALECRNRNYLFEITESQPEKFSEDGFESNVLWNRAWLDYLAGSREKPPTWISNFVGRRF